MTIQTEELITAEQLASQLKQCESWAEVESIIAIDPGRKSEIWELLDEEAQTRIKLLKQVSILPGISVGDLVSWADCPGSLQVFNPFRCRCINGDQVWLDWIYHPVARHRLSKITPD